MSQNRASLLKALSPNCNCLTIIIPTVDILRRLWQLPKINADSGESVFDFYMKKKQIQICLIVAISLSILVSSIYYHYYSLASADFISHNLKLENFDQEFLLVTSVSRLKIFGPSGFSIISALCINSIEKISLFLLLTSPFNQRKPILRC